MSTEGEARLSPSPVPPVGLFKVGKPDVFPILVDVQQTKLGPRSGFQQPDDLGARVGHAIQANPPIPVLAHRRARKLAAISAMTPNQCAHAGRGILEHVLHVLEDVRGWGSAHGGSVALSARECKGRGAGREGNGAGVTDHGPRAYGAKQ